MSKLIKAIEKETNKTTTTNGAKAFKSTLSKTVDLFASIGAMRGKNILPSFALAYGESKDVAVRTALWARDVRGGAGERKLYRDILQYLAKSDYQVAQQLLDKTVELGRWDDLLVLIGTPVQKEVINKIRVALESGDGLCAKWMPRKGETAAVLRKELGYTAKFYRKRLVELTNVVETAMCAKDWSSIEYSHVPSVASARYQKAFARNDNARYAEFISKVEKGEVKMNAGAVYPYDVIRSLRSGVKDAANAQWKALPDFIGNNESNFLCVVDVSGSMGCPAGGSGSVTCMDVAVSLGLYCSERSKGIFKDTFVTFSERPQLQQVSGTLEQRYNQMFRSDWGMSTNLESVFDLVLTAAKKGKVPQEEMPSHLLIMSDMQFNCVRDGTNKTLFKAAKKAFKEAGYQLPKVVFWNINHHGNHPVKHDENNTALVSGFSPAIMQSLLSDTAVTPEDLMLETLMVERYNWQ
jgi:hypothetical protein